MIITNCQHTIRCDQDGFCMQVGPETSFDAVVKNATDLGWDVQIVSEGQQITEVKALCPKHKGARTEAQLKADASTLLGSLLNEASDQRGKMMNIIPDAWVSHKSGLRKDIETIQYLWGWLKREGIVE